MSHSIHMLNIQIDTKSFEFTISSTTSNCPFLQAIRLLEYKITHKAEKRIKIFCIFHELITRHQMGLDLHS